ncbi:MAG: hypothetical protein WCH00_01450 [Candidatus Saccharibacteria bacterium]
MNEIQHKKVIRRFVAKEIPEQTSYEESEDYTYHTYDSSNMISEDQMKLVDENALLRASRAADETAMLQAKINAERKNLPIDLDTKQSNVVSRTAYLQHQIDLRRKQ